VAANVLLLPLQLRFVGPVLLEPVEILEEQQPRRLVKLRGTSGFLPEDVVNVPEGLLKHCVDRSLTRGRAGERK